MRYGSLQPCSIGRMRGARISRSAKSLSERDRRSYPRPSVPACTFTWSSTAWPTGALTLAGTGCFSRRVRTAGASFGRAIRTIATGKGPRLRPPRKTSRPSIASYSTGTTGTTHDAGPRETRQTRSWPCAGPVEASGRTSMRMSTCAGCAGDGNEETLSKAVALIAFDRHAARALIA